MLSPNDPGFTPEATEHTTDAMERLEQPPNRRNHLDGRRQSFLQQKQTDALPQVNSDTTSGKPAWRQVIQLREENKRLRYELNILQARLDQERAAIQSSHQQEIEQYQHHLRDLMEEHNQMQEAQRALEQRYQKLYHSFLEAVEEEAHKMITEAVHTVELSPQQPVVLRDLKKTIELQARQVEDQHVAQTLYLMREAQHKAQQMEQELDRERQQIATERQNLVTLQTSIRTQAQLRYDTQKTQLQAHWTFKVTVTVTIALLCVLALQGAFVSLGLPLLFSSIAAIFVAVVLAAIVARAWSLSSHIRTSTPRRIIVKEKK